MDKMPALTNLKSLPYGGAQYVISPDMEQFVMSAVTKSANNRSLWDTNIKQEFLQHYRAWIASTKNNRIRGLDLFPISTFSAGATESFDKFYLKHTDRRLRYFKGEYMYHQVAGRQYFRDAKFVEDAPLHHRDVLVLSLPFADTGNSHSDMQQTLVICSALGIPVLLDCAYFGVCAGIDIDLDHDCITDVTFSLSKTFPVPHLRIGMRLSRHDDDDLLLVLNKTDYVNRLSCDVGLELIKTFGPDWIFDRYRSSQQDLCQSLEVDASNCVFFGIDRQQKFAQYNRGGKTNRLCLSKYLHINAVDKF